MCVCVCACAFKGMKKRGRPRGGKTPPQCAMCSTHLWLPLHMRRVNKGIYVCVYNKCGCLCVIVCVGTEASGKCLLCVCSPPKQPKQRTINLMMRHHDECLRVWSMIFPLHMPKYTETQGLTLTPTLPHTQHNATDLQGRAGIFSLLPLERRHTHNLRSHQRAYHIIASSLCGLPVCLKYIQ